MIRTRFEASADQLAEALQTDIGWIRQHTEFGEAARRWSAAGRPGGLLLRSPVLEVAEHWIASRPRAHRSRPKRLRHSSPKAATRRDPAAQRPYGEASAHTACSRIIAALVGLDQSDLHRGAVELVLDHTRPICGRAGLALCA